MYKVSRSSRGAGDQEIRGDCLHGERSQTGAIQPLAAAGLLPLVCKHQQTIGGMMIAQYLYNVFVKQITYIKIGAE